jgi:hypothetical protein
MLSFRWANQNSLRAAPRNCTAGSYNYLTGKPRRRIWAIEPLSTFEFMAELGLALAGFAGVGSAFGGRGRKYSEIDLIRLMVLFLSAGAVIAGSLAVLTFAAYGLEFTTVYWIVSTGLAVLVGMVGASLLAAAWRTVKDPEIVAPAWVFTIGILYFLVVEVLFLHNAVVVRESSPLIAAFSISLVFGLWMFTRLMVRHNR